MAGQLDSQLPRIQYAAYLSLLESWLRCDSLVQEQMAESLGRLPQAWWYTSEQ